MSKRYSATNHCGICIDDWSLSSVQCPLRTVKRVILSESFY